ncbi:hypothetical protein [Fischerella sp. PCC 9605]|uniref:hypothetical protein n=1 Tax=Fischerella sp. PCC 9605 TaxID=1173024 RepID=UPI00047C85A1|nr:hypothetical protein [Fischerella sp. PCC 9605]
MKDNQHEQLFTELTPEEAAVIEGSGAFVEDIRFDTYDTTRSFYVPPGGDIILTSTTQSGKNNRLFTASIRNLKTNNTNAKTVRVGRGIRTEWKGVRGGNYKIDFRDTKDGVFVSGRANVSYT